MTPVHAAVLTVSDSCAAGAREDRSGPALISLLKARGWSVAHHSVVPDDVSAIASTVSSLASGGFNLILTTGGTGIAPRDVTPEAIRTLTTRELPGFGELMRAEGARKTPLAPLSRSFAATLASALVLCLPGSPAGACESLEAVAHLIPHAVDLLAGNTAHSPVVS